MAGYGMRGYIVGSWSHRDNNALSRISEGPLFELTRSTPSSWELNIHYRIVSCSVTTECIHCNLSPRVSMYTTISPRVAFALQLLESSRNICSGKARQEPSHCVCFTRLSGTNIPIQTCDRSSVEILGGSFQSSGCYRESWHNSFLI